MWRVALNLVVHRCFLLLVAFVVINLNLSSETPQNGLFRIQPLSLIWGQFVHRVSETPEMESLKPLLEKPLLKVFGETHNPSLWVCRWVIGLTHFSPLATLLLVSNLFLFLFLWELHALLNRLAMPDVALGTVVLAILWPTSYELSLGSTFSMSCFLVTLVVRHALDNQWLLGGIGMGALSLVEPMALGLLPLILYLFWYFQRNFPAGDVVKRACFFLIPFALALLWRFRAYSEFIEMAKTSAFFSLFSAAMQKQPLDWTFSHTLAGQTLTAIFFGTGAIIAAVANVTLVHKIIPIYLFLLLLLFSPYGTLASRALVAAPGLQGVVAYASRPVTRAVQTVLFFLSVFEVASVFN